MRSAQRVVETLAAYGVRFIFGVPGAKIDAVYDALARRRPATGRVPSRAERGVHGRRGRPAHRHAGRRIGDVGPRHHESGHRTDHRHHRAGPDGGDLRCRAAGRPAQAHPSIDGCRCGAEAVHEVHRRGQRSRQRPRSGRQRHPHRAHPAARRRGRGATRRRVGGPHISGNRRADAGAGSGCRTGRSNCPGRQLDSGARNARRCSSVFAPATPHHVRRCAS